MEKQYDFTQQDYLEAKSLEKANAHQGAGLFTLILFLGVGVLAYLNVATFRGSLASNDSLAYSVGGVIAVLLLVNYSPRLIPTLTLPVRVRLGLIAPGVIGTREFGMKDQYLEFRYGGMLTRVAYEGLSRVNHNEKSVLFYLLNGACEAVPLRVLGMKTLTEIASRAQKANAKSTNTVLPRFKSLEAEQVTCTVTETDALHCNRPEVVRQRRSRAKNPMTWLYLAVILLCFAGGLYGLASGAGAGLSFAGYLKVFYVLEILGSAIAFLYWFRPVWMVNYGLRSTLRLGRYPTGYLGERKIEWDAEGIAYRYGVIGLSADWDTVTEVRDDGSYLYFYQGESLLLFLKKEELAANASALEFYIRDKIRPMI